MGMGSFNMGLNKPKGASIQKQQQWKSFSPQKKSTMLKRYPDVDGDRVPNRWDCQPNNSRRQDDKLDPNELDDFFENFGRDGQGLEDIDEQEKYYEFEKKQEEEANKAYNKLKTKKYTDMTYDEREFFDAMYTRNMNTSQSNNYWKNRAQELKNAGIVNEPDGYDEYR